MEILSIEKAEQLAAQDVAELREQVAELAPAGLARRELLADGSMYSPSWRTLSGGNHAYTVATLDDAGAAACEAYHEALDRGTDELGLYWEEGCLWADVPASSDEVGAVTAAYVETALWAESIGDDAAEQLTSLQTCAQCGAIRASHPAGDGIAQCAGDFPRELAGDTSFQSAEFGLHALAPDALHSIAEDVREFLDSPELSEALRYWAEQLGTAQLGHDFYLTRNRHGAGFWDRFAAGEGEAYGRELTDAAHAFGDSGLYLGDDSLIYLG